MLPFELLFSLFIRSRTLTPERLTRSKCNNASMIQNAHRVEKYDCNVPRAHCDLSEISSYCSSNVSNKVLDRYIDGEQMEICDAKSKFSGKNQFENGSVVKRPPRFQPPALVSRDARKQKPKSQSFRETKISKLQVPSKDACDNEYCNESPRKVARNVVERLSQSRMRSKEFDSDNPITIEDVYGRTLNKSSNAYTDRVSPKHCTMDWYTETSDGSHNDEFSEFLEKESSSGDKDIYVENIGAVTNADVELFKKFKQAGDRAAMLSDELEKRDFIQFRGLTVPVLIQTIRSLTEEKANMAQEVLSVLEDRIAERALFREKLTQGRMETDALSLRLEKEKNEIQLTLEKELDRRSTEWSLKLEKLKAEEQRLRERVRELAEQNVCLQREVSSSSEREMETRTQIINSDKQLGDLSIQVEQVMEENNYLQKTLSALQEKTRAAEEDRDCIRRNYEEKVAECKDMHSAISRLQRTCNDQEKTIDGLRGLCEELGRKISQGTFDFGIAKLQIEHVRLTGVEHALRKEVESYRVEIDSLRSENIDLLNRLKNKGKEGEFSTFKLDRELQSRISCLQNQLLPLLTESSQLSKKLIAYVKTNGCFPPKNGPTCLGGQVLVECEVKIQGLERVAENLATSMKTISSVIQEKSTLLHEKSSSVDVGPQISSFNDESQKRNEQKSEVDEPSCHLLCLMVFFSILLVLSLIMHIIWFTFQDMVRSAFKAETLLTGLLREKLYSREHDVEQLQAELAAAVRGNDILKSEVQNAVDDFSCLNHKMKELELQVNFSTNFFFNNMWVINFWEISFIVL